MAALQGLTDPRRRRGVRRPFAAVLALTFLGLLCRQTDFAVIARWAKAHGHALRESLGFIRRYAPHAATLTRVTARYSLAEFQGALCRWLAGLLARDATPARRHCAAGLGQNGVGPVRALGARGVGGEAAGADAGLALRRREVRLAAPA